MCLGYTYANFYIFPKSSINMKIVLISCASRKKNEKSQAGELYTSPLFRFNLKYAKSLNPGRIFILSAKHHLLELNEEIEPYNETLNEKNKEEIKIWAEKVLEQLKEKTNLNEDEFIFLAGENYRKFLIPEIKNYNIPMQNLGIGKQLKFLNENTR